MEVAIVPRTEKDLATVTQNMARLLLHQARMQMQEEFKDETYQHYNGAEKEALIAERAVLLHGWMVMALNATGKELSENFKHAGRYHPDLRSSPEELLHEMVDRLSETRQGQAHFFIHEIVPEARRLDVDVNNWLRSVRMYNLMEVVPDFRDLMGATHTLDPDSDKPRLITEEERRQAFERLVDLSTQPLSVIRQVRSPGRPEPFTIIETELGDGVRWEIPLLTKITADWLFRRTQPLAKKETM